MAPKIYTRAGHGGTDPGAVDGKSTGDTLYTEEEDVNLACTTKFNTALARNGFVVKTARTGDTTISLEAGVSAANAWGASRFVSWHFNSATPAARGLEILFYPGSVVGKDMASDVYTYMEKVSPWPDRGLVPRPGLYELAHTKMPAIIIEGGFLTNTEEEKLINTPGYQTLLAEAACKGMCAHFKMTYKPPTAPQPVDQSDWFISSQDDGLIVLRPLKVANTKPWKIASQSTSILSLRR